MLREEWVCGCTRERIHNKNLFNKGNERTNEEVKCEIAAVVEFGGITRTCGGIVDGKNHKGENVNDNADLVEKVAAKTRVVKNVEDKEVIF